MRIENIGDATLYLGDVLEVLATMPDESVHCVVTSPPYWGLRDYGTGTWEGGSAECDHIQPVSFSKSTLGASTGGRSTETHERSIGAQASPYREVCGKCGARRIDQQIGLEETPEQYVAKIVAVFREVRRVLRSDGTAWVNLGSSYAGGGRGGNPEESEFRKQATNVGSLIDPTPVPAGFKPKDMIPIPWMVAMALQADGWYLRSDIIWAKPNPMPESVTDRPTKAHEYLFLLSKSAKYFYDADAVREITGREATADEYDDARKETWPSGGIERHAGSYKNAHAPALTHPSGRNRRTVWNIATEAFPGAHFATFPRKLVQPCILAGCPEHACPECGAPWEREVEISYTDAHRGMVGNQKKAVTDGMVMHAGRENDKRMDKHSTTIGEHPTCACGLAPIGGTVLDPFGGSGTTGEVALEYGRRAILIELKPEYVELAKKRLRPVAGRPMLNFVE
jgi:DNA modification methylase